MKFALALQRVPEHRAERGQCPVLIAATEKELRRSQTSRGQDDTLGGLFAANHPPVLDAIEDNPVFAALRLDEANQVQRPHLGAVLLGSWNVIDVEAVLGPHVASDVAVAQMDARPLFLPVRVDELAGVFGIERVLELVVPVFGETDGQRRLRESLGIAEVARGLAGELEAVGQLAVGNDLQVHFASHSCRTTASTRRT